jgi:hypothetical protein
VGGLGWLPAGQIHKTAFDFFVGEDEMAESGRKRLVLSLTNSAERIAVCRSRHDVYAIELRQHQSRPDGVLPDTEGLFLRDIAGIGLGLGRHALRIAVKDAALNRRLLDILQGVLRPIGKPEGIRAGT